ncbi:MAG: YncE family protein [Longimicrobiaceae bacterium]
MMRMIRLGGRDLLVAALALAAASGCGAARPPSPPPECGGVPSPASPGAEAAPPGPASEPPLGRVADVPLPGPAVRFDYQAVDTAAGRLYVAHMNAGTLLVFDTREARVVADLPGFPSVHGVWAVPELGKVYAAVTGRRQVAVLDARTLRVRARPGPIGYPDGIAYDPGTRRIYVSDESSAGRELVIDGATDGVVGTVALGGEAGNTLYDPGSRCIWVAVQTRDEVAAIDPRSNRVVGRYPLPGADHPHGLAIDSGSGLLFVANEGSATLLVVDLRTMEVVSTHPVGDDPDVLAFDPGLARLYVASESGVVSVFRVQRRDLVPLGELRMPHAHTVAADAATHRVYLPLENVGGRPVLRIMAP